jgi:hypothetical protein
MEVTLTDNAIKVLKHITSRRYLSDIIKADIDQIANEAELSIQQVGKAIGELHDSKFSILRISNNEEHTVDIWISKRTYDIAKLFV